MKNKDIIKRFVEILSPMDVDSIQAILLECYQLLPNHIDDILKKQKCIVDFNDDRTSIGLYYIIKYTRYPVIILGYDSSVCGYYSEAYLSHVWGNAMVETEAQRFISIFRKYRIKNLLQ
jgi:hypothetical protein